MFVGCKLSNSSICDISRHWSPCPNQVQGVDKDAVQEEVDVVSEVQEEEEDVVLEAPGEEVDVVLEAQEEVDVEKQEEGGVALETAWLIDTTIEVSVAEVGEEEGVDLEEELISSGI